MIRIAYSAPIVLILSIIQFAGLRAQENGSSTILRVGDEKVSKTEFKTIYFKNNKDSVVTEKALSDYMDLFIDFKLKVKEAEKLGLDTTQKFKREFQRYKEQLARPYLIDSATKRELLKEAYRRTKKQVHTSHILVRINEDPLPKDTLAAYQKAQRIKERIQASDSSFLSVGKALAAKDKKLQASDLGYFDAFRMVYPFEEAAYKTPVGGISDPVRTQYGYHLIKVHDKRASEGKLKVAHIMKHAPRKASPQQKKQAKAKIEELHKKLRNGVDFHRLARKHSDDRKTRRRGGRLPWFTFGEMLPSFSKAAFALDSNGAVSEPVRSRYGWHIIKRLDKKPLPSFEEMRPKLEKELRDSDRSAKVREAVIERLKEEYDLNVKKARVKRFIKSLPDSSFVPSEWLEENEKLASKELFSFADTNSYEVESLALRLGEKEVLPEKMAGKRTMVERDLEEMIDNAIIHYEKERLDEKYPRYRALLQEYRDGILLFELMEKKVWNKALKDTVGLRRFYKKNKDEYRWEKRLNLTFYRCDTKEAAKEVQGMLKKGSSRKSILKSLRKGKSLKCQLDSGAYEKGDREFLSKIEWEKGISKLLPSDGSFIVGKVHEVLPPAPKKLEEARGLVSSDYQDHLEKRWVDQLREEYEIDVNRKLLRSIAEEEGQGR